MSIFCDWLSGITDGYEDYQKLGAFWLISSFCDSNVVVKLKQQTVTPNIFVTIFGKSTTSRKSTVVQRTRQIYESVTGEYLPNEDFSIEGYLESLAASPCQHHVRDEVAGFLAKIHKQYNEGFTELECALYDGQSFRKTLASKGAKDPKIFEIRNPYVTKFYATTPDNYIKYMTIEDFLCGYQYRVLFSFPTHGKPKMALGVESVDDIKRWSLVLERASEIYHCMKNGNGIQFSFDSDALDYYGNITSAIEDEADKTDNGILTSAVGRSQIHILKLAMLIELGKHPISTTITKESIIIAANMVTNYFIPTLMDVVDRLQEDVKNNQIERVLAVIRRNGGAIQHTKALHDSKLKSKEFAEVIFTLRESETIDVVVEKETKKTFYLLSEMRQTLNLSTFENLPNLQNLPSLLVSNGKTKEEILETLKYINKFDLAHIEDGNIDKNINSPSPTNIQSNIILSLQNPQVCFAKGDQEISENREIKEIPKVRLPEKTPNLKDSLVTSLEEAAKILEEEGY